MSISSLRYGAGSAAFSQPGRLPPERAVGLALVIALHVAALYGIWTYRVQIAAASADPIFVNFIAPEAQVQKPPPPAPARPVKLDRPRPVEPVRQLVAEAPVDSPTEVVAPPPPREAPPAVVAAPAPPVQASGPVTLHDELSLACPDRPPPAYPSLARRRGEEGRAVLRVELDEQGSVGRATVATSSGSDALDAAALAAVRNWHCQPARRGGQAVRAIALQPFNFTLQGQ